MDEVFENSHINNRNFEHLLYKIQNNAVFIVAYKDDKPIGYVAAYVNDFIEKIAYITLIAVCKQYQNQHVGHELMEYIKKIARGSDMRAIKLEVEKTNTKAYSFYTRNSFVYYSECSEKSDYLIYYL